MHTHVLYRCYGRIKQYFAGEYKGERNTEGTYDVSFAWTTDIRRATTFLTTDAWDLLGMCRHEWENMKFEVERICTN